MRDVRGIIMAGAYLLGYHKALQKNRRNLATWLCVIANIYFLQQNKKSQASVFLSVLSALSCTSFICLFFFSDHDFIYFHPFMQENQPPNRMEAVSFTNASCEIAMSCFILNRPTVYHRNILLIPEHSEAGQTFFQKRVCDRISNQLERHTKRSRIFQINSRGK